MCVTLSVKLGEVLAQNKHCPGTNFCMVASGESIDSLEGVGVGLVSGLNDRLIREVSGVATVVEVVTVVVSTIKVD